MVRVLAVAALVGMAAGLTAADDEANKKAAKALEGKYAAKALKKGGQDAPPQMIDDVDVVVIADGKITIKMKAGREEPVKYAVVDAGQKPPHIDLTQLKGEMKLMKGIYKVEKGVLTIVIAREGDRPKDFKAEGENEMRMVFEKKKDE